MVYGYIDNRGITLRVALLCVAHFTVKVGEQPKKFVALLLQCKAVFL